jgi:hypothetical protein
MMELMFKLTRDGREPRDIIVRIHGPTRNPPEKSWPWNAAMELDGRRYSNPGIDPLDAIESACQLAAHLLLSLYEGYGIDPPIEPRASASPAAEPPDPAKDD